MKIFRKMCTFFEQKKANFQFLFCLDNPPPLFWGKKSSKKKKKIHSQIS